MEIQEIDKFRILLAYQAGLTVESIANGYEVLPHVIKEILEGMIDADYK